MTVNLSMANNKTPSGKKLEGVAMFTVNLHLYEE